MADRCVFVIGVASLLLCAACEQVLGIHDPQPNSTAGPDAKPGGGVVMDANNGANACAPLPSLSTTPAKMPASYNAGDSLAFAVGHLDGDAMADAVWVQRNSSAGEVWIKKGIANGGFGTDRKLHSTPTLATGLLIADVDGDGDADIVTWEGASPVAGSQTTHSISVHRQDDGGAGTFATPQTISFPQGTLVKGVVAGNLNGDAAVDLIVQTSVSGMDETYPYIASTSTLGTFTKGARIATAMQGTTTPSHVLDVDGDGYDDVVFTRMSSGLGIYFNIATTPGTFSAVSVSTGDSENASFGHYKSTTRLDFFLWSRSAATPDGALYEQTAPRMFTKLSTVIDNVHVDDARTAGGGLPRVDLNGDGLDDVVGADDAEIQCPGGAFWPSRSEPSNIRLGDEVQPTVVRQFIDINPGGTVSKPDLIGLDANAGSTGNFLKVWLQ